MLLREFYESTYQPLRLPSASHHYKRRYRYLLTDFAVFIGRAPTLADLTDEAVTAYLSHCSDTGSTPGTVNTHRRQLVSLWRFAHLRRAVDTLPNVHRWPEPERVPVAWTLDELQRLLASCGAERGEIAGLVPAAAWWLALVRVLWNTGERIDAALQIERARVDLRGRWLNVPGDVRKGRTKEMLYRIQPATCEAIERIWQPQRRALFVWILSRTSLYNHFNRILERAGLPSDRMSKFHRLRRSFASHLEAAGGNATEALGHSRREITRRAYLDPRVCGGSHPGDLLPDVPEAQ